MKMFFRCSIAVVLLTLAYAQVPFPGSCPAVNIPETFDLDAYMGIWYEYSKYPFVFEIGKKCMYANYENIGNNTISVVNAAINRFTNRQSNITGQAKVLGPGQLAVVFSKNQNADKPNYLVLGTDYSSYALVYSCTNFSTVAHTKIVWILTRERKPAPEAVNAAKKVMEDNNLLQAFLIDTLQDDCPEAGIAPDTKLPGVDTKAETNSENHNAEAANASTDANEQQPSMIDKA